MLYCGVQRMEGGEMKMEEERKESHLWHPIPTGNRKPLKDFKQGQTEFDLFWEDRFCQWNRNCLVKMMKT